MARVSEYCVVGRGLRISLPARRGVHPLGRPLVFFEFAINEAITSCPLNSTWLATGLNAASTSTFSPHPPPSPPPVFVFTMFLLLRLSTPSTTSSSSSSFPLNPSCKPNLFICYSSVLLFQLNFKWCKGSAVLKSGTPQSACPIF